MAATTVVYEPMKMTDLINITQEMSAAGAALTKESGDNYTYDSTATSTECIESLQSCRRGLRCKLPGAFGNTQPMFDIGLISAAACPQHQNSVDYLEITYSAFIKDGTLSVWECGRDLGKFSTVEAGDTIEIGLTSEHLPNIEYRVNGWVVYTSKKETSMQAPFFAKVCAGRQTRLLEDLQWILEPSPHTRITELQSCITEQQAHTDELQTQIAQQQTRITELQTQLQISEAEKDKLKAGAEEKEAEIEALRAVVEQQKREMTAVSEAVLAIRNEKTELQMQLEAYRDASRAAAEEKVPAEMHQAQQTQPQEDKDIFSELIEDEASQTADGVANAF